MIPLEGVTVAVVTLVVATFGLVVSTMSDLDKISNTSGNIMSSENIREDVETNNAIMLAGQNIQLHLMKDEPSDPHGLHRYFSTTHFGTMLSLSLLSDAKKAHFTPADIEFLLNLMRTRFSRVMMYPVNKDTINIRDPLSYIPTAAAKLNSDTFHQRPDQSYESLQASMAKPLRISIPFTFAVSNDNISWQRSFDVAKTLADKANDIFPQTTEFLVIYLPGPTFLPPGDLKDVEETLKQFKMQLGQYELGIMFDLRGCATVNFFQMVIDYFLPQVQLVFLIHKEKVNPGDDPTTIYMAAIRELEKCTQILKEHFPNTTTKFILEFNAVDSPKELIALWQQMNAYAVERNTTVFMMDGFDQVQTLTKGSGWWSITALELHEKYQDVYNSTSTGNDDEDNGDFITTLIVITSGVVIAVVFLSAAAVTVWNRKRGNVRVKRASFRSLTSQEVLAFFEGQPFTEIDDQADSTIQTDEYVKMKTLLLSYAYDKSLEVEKHNFTIDKSKKLGSGTFGKVCMGKMKLGETNVITAVKRVNRGGAREDALVRIRSILLEIKVLSFLGKHENVVTLLGAHTNKLRKGQVYVFLEFCSLGSLQQYLSNLKDVDDESVNIGYSSFIHNPQEMKPLEKWSMDVVNGMCFLVSKHVVHADLAARNVLLDKSKNAKICDFGLSRRMLNCQSYIKTHDEPLPWRSMSPESLRNSIFNEKTDVWAFGVTLWEIYTLGEIPYAGVSGDSNFGSLLENGLRLPAPNRRIGFLSSGPDIYKVMKLCWEINPSDRPSFQQLKIALQKPT